LFRLPFDLAHWKDWLIMGGLVVASTLLYFENRSEAQKIFENDW
jgi:hypothetical protein